MGIFDFRRKKREKGEPPGGTSDALTEGKRLRFEELLLEQDLEAARGVALAYAYRRTLDLVADRDDAGPRRALARQLVDRALALAWERCSWDPNRGPTLPVYLCSIVRSELSHDHEAAEGREAVEQEAALEPSVPTGDIPGPEALVLAKEEKNADAREASSDIDWLRAFFEKKGDAVNLRWLDLRARDVDDEPAEMARCSEFDAEDFYNAQKRRMRAAGRLLAHKAGRGDDDEETE